MYLHHSRAVDETAIGKVHHNNSIVDAEDGPPPPSLQPQYPWSITATVGPLNGEISIDDHCLICPIRRASKGEASQQFDLSQSTEWMEFLEHQEDRLADEGGAGAYDTLRCDLILNSNKDDSGTDDDANYQSTNSNRRRIWGEEYHLKRLQASYMSLLKVSDDDATINEVHASLEVAIKESRTILEQILKEAENSKAVVINVSNGELFIQMLRVTLLWSPPKEHYLSSKNGDVPKIVVRGHACCSCNPIKIDSKPDPIVVSVAVHSRDDGNHSRNGDSEIYQSPIVKDTLPTRHAKPHSKIASWCRARKTLENPNRYKPPGTSEVLMVRPRLDAEGITRLEILEGLSSNFFVVYKNGFLRTARSGVLHGYVRHLVLEVAGNCGLELDPQPIYLHQRDQWKEAFITSSSRLIYPISSILLPKDADVVDIAVKQAIGGATAWSSTPTSKFVEYWSDPFFSNLETDNELTPPKWQELLDEILKVGGYSDSILMKAGFGRYSDVKLYK